MSGEGGSCTLFSRREAARLVTGNGRTIAVMAQEIGVLLRTICHHCRFLARPSPFDTLQNQHNHDPHGDSHRQQVFAKILSELGCLLTAITPQ